MATKTKTDELHPDGAERPSEAAMREADAHEAPADIETAAGRRARSETRQARKAAKPRKPSSSSSAKRVTGREAVLKVLADGQPQKAKDITAAAVKLIRPASTGKTPEATLGAFLYTQAKKADGAVEMTGKAEFRLRPPAIDGSDEHDAAVKSGR